MQNIVVGIDEAGRGPLAGPVIAAAFCMLDTSGIRTRGDFDSKKLQPHWREDLYEILTHHPQIEWGIGQVSQKKIDNINIFQATRLAMRKAFQDLRRKLLKRGAEPALVIIDGKALLDIAISQKAIPHADATVWQCMAASIIAKVTRDRLMANYHTLYPQYGFNKHMGYGTAYHFQMLEKYGPSPIHRRSFAPVAKFY